MVFNVEGQASTVGSGATVAASLSAASSSDFVGAFVAWSGAVDVASLADAGTHTWTKKGSTFSIAKVNGVVLTTPINVAYFWTTTSAALVADAITATFTGAGATRSLITVFAVALAKITSPFDTNVGLGYPGVQGLTSSAAFSVLFSTHLNHFAAIAFTVLFPDPGGEAYGATWTGQNKGTATDFGWILESKLFTSVQTSTPAPFVTTSGNYTAISIVDAIEATDSTAFSVSELYESEGLPVDTTNSGLNKESFTEALPITQTATSITHDLSGGDASGHLVTQTATMKKSPQDALDSGSNEYNETVAYTET